MSKTYVTPALVLIKVQTASLIGASKGEIVDIDPSVNVDESDKVRPWQGTMSNEW